MFNLLNLNDQNGIIPKNAHAAYQTKLYEEVWLPDRQTLDKVIPMYRYAFQRTEKPSNNLKFWDKMEFSFSQLRQFSMYFR